MKDKLICAMLSNIKDVTCKNGNFWLETKDDYIRVITTQKFIIEKVEDRKGNFFRKTTYREYRNYLQEWTYELVFKKFRFDLDKSVYEKIKEKRNEYIAKKIDEELDNLCKPSKK